MRSPLHSKSTTRIFANTYEYSLRFPIFVSPHLQKLNPHHANNKYIIRSMVYIRYMEFFISKYELPFLEVKFPSQRGGKLSVRSRPQKR